MKTIDYKANRDAKVLLIGHDPRLQNSDTVANYALFADYYFNPEPKSGNEKSKYLLAKASFDQILHLTDHKIAPETIYVTNLCNEPLPHTPNKKTVLIPEIMAHEGISNIIEILNNNNEIEYIFPMSLQVNYWLQKLGFYVGNSEFVENSEPKLIGINNNPPYYEPKKSRSFLQICGNIYKKINGNQFVIPILHSKCFPLKSRFSAYQENYQNIINHFNSII